MIKVHGFTISNYFNMVKMALLEKGVEVVETRGSQGKITFLYSVTLAGACAKRVLDMDLLGDSPEAKELAELLGSRDSAKQIAAHQKW